MGEASISFFSLSGANSAPVFGTACNMWIGGVSWAAENDSSVFGSIMTLGDTSLVGKQGSHTSCVDVTFMLTLGCVQLSSVDFCQAGNTEG